MKGLSCFLKKRLKYSLLILLVLSISEPLEALDLASLFGQESLILLANPYSGELLGANKYQGLDEEVLVGSVFKLLTALVILEEGLAGLTVNCDYYYPQASQPPLTCTYAGGHGLVDLKEALSHSCNYYFYRQSEELASEKIWNLYNLFLDKNKAYPDLKTPYYQLAIGLAPEAQMTPRQILTMTMALVNGGLIYDLTRPGQAPRALPVSPKNLSFLQEAMLLVVQEGTGQKAALENIALGGKTGTSPSGAFFVGAYPLPYPSFAFLIFLPQGKAGSEAAFIARELVLYLEGLASN